jgi:anthranilate synthase component 1
MIRPRREEFLKLSKQGRRVPVMREISADTDTPVSAFLKVGRGGSHAFLLESVESGEKWARYSILGSDPRAVYTAEGGRVRIEEGENVRETESSSPLTELDRWVQSQKVVPIPGLPPFWGGAVGFLSYDAARSFEKLPAHAKNDLRLPDGVFLLMDTVVVFDNLSLTLKVITSRPAGRNPEKTYDDCVQRIDQVVEQLRGALPERPAPPKARNKAKRFESSFTRSRYEAAVARAKEHIHAGDAVQIVLAQRFHKRLHCDPFEVYRALRVINPSSYMYYLKLGERHLVGSSPEVLVRQTGRRIELRPIAGTRGRGGTRAEDLALEAELLADEKERAEHVMLVDLGRNDVGRVAEFGSVRVSEFMTVERYSHVMHLVSNVVGQARKDVTSLDVLRACFPAGTVSGAPKVRAMEIIEELEPVRRGTYAGAVGYLSFDGNLDTCLAIRTGYVENGDIHVGSGAGIVADSVPAREYEETLNKARALFTAVATAEREASARRAPR